MGRSNIMKNLNEGINNGVKKALANSKLNGRVMCENCKWVNKFTPRQDELDRGLTMGCKKPGWEGYTKNEKPVCDGVFFSEIST